MGKEEEKREVYAPLFHKKAANGLLVYRIFAASLLVSILTVLIYRSTHLHLHLPEGEGEGEGGEGEGEWKRKVRRWGWMGILAAELWFGLYWILSQSLRWNPVRRSTFNHTLSQRYENELPGVDVFVCTADPALEPPALVINTVLSVMAYDYPPEKLSVYLSDDGGSDLTFYALWEASTFARQWLPYCRSFNVEPRSPAAYFKSASEPVEPRQAAAFSSIKQSQDIGFVQFPQIFKNMTKNDLYGSSLRVIREVELYGLDGIGGPSYMGSGCFHQREWKTVQNEDKTDMEISIIELEHSAKGLTSCTYELNTRWGKEMGLKYGCPLEDIITGLSIQCRGWKMAYYNPRRPSFMGVAPTSLNEVLVQHKRWGEGDFQIFLSKFCPFWFGHGKISLLLQMGYVYYCLWACNCLATLFYSTIPSLFLINGIPLFPQVTSLWFTPFAYIIIASYTYNLREFLMAEGTVLGWWNEQRMWLYKRLSSYLFALTDSILKLVGLSDMKFVITAKVADEDVTERYMLEKMEFGVSSPMFTILATLALVNLFCLVVAVKRFTTGEATVEKFGLQVLICWVLVALNLPLYEAIFLRKDKGKVPSSVTLISVLLSLLICACFSALL